MNQRIRKYVLFLDLMWISTAFVFAYLLRYEYLGFGPRSRNSFREFLPGVGSALLIWTFLYLSKRLDGFAGGWHLPTILAQMIVAVFYLMVFLLSLSFLQKTYYSRLLLLYLACLLPFGLLTIRCLMRWAIASRSWNGGRRRAVILGSGHLAHELAYKISCHPELLLEVVGLLYPSGDASNGFAGPQQEPISLQSLNVHRMLQERNVKELIVVMPHPVGADAEKLISKCREAGMLVRLVPQGYELYVSEAQMVEVDGVPLISLEERNISALALALKRAFDFVGGLFFVVLCSPFLAFPILSLKRRRGRAFDANTRCGAGGSVFRMLRLNIDRDNPGSNGLDGLLASLSLTELPQLWNVVRGDMSLVGPRPEAPERVRHYSDWQRQRLSVKPGLTGLAQVHGLREQHSSEEKARFDLQYIFHWSLFLDFSLILQTAWTLVIRLLEPVGAKTSINPRAYATVTVPLKEVLDVNRSQPSAD
jgi:lipopolysaccharide/colanic/teichoic acid biosynthesis glycosyltransferase